MSDVRQKSRGAWDWGHMGVSSHSQRVSSTSDVRHGSRGTWYRGRTNGLSRLNTEYTYLHNVSHRSYIERSVLLERVETLRQP